MKQQYKKKKYWNNKVIINLEDADKIPSCSSLFKNVSNQLIEQNGHQRIIPNIHFST